MLESLWDFWPYALTLVDLVLSIGASVHVVLNKREPRAAIGWVGLIWLSPFVGFFVYLLFGVNRLTRRAVALGLQDQARPARALRLAPDEEARFADFSRRHPTHADLARLVGKLTEHPLVPGNRVTSLLDGDAFYPEMLGAIDGARHSIALVSYIFDNDPAGQIFVHHLRAARERGVEVRVLVDAVGARYSRPTILSELDQAGIRAAAFLPTRVPWQLKYANLRNHRKILVVDGVLGFTGGSNIRAGHWLALKPTAPVSCLHFRFEGPVVAHLREVFALDWAFTTGEMLSGEKWFPEIARVGAVWARGIPSGPDEDLDKMSLAILGALAAARERVAIVNPYFLPEQPIAEALKAAALRGVDVRILLPAFNNITLVQWAAAPLLPFLLERGCRIYFSPPPFDHTKLFLVDGIWSLVGSTNWDARSLRLNFEFNVECYSTELGAALAAIVNQRLDRARELTLDEATGRGTLARVRDGFARLLSPYL